MAEEYIKRESAIEAIENDCSELVYYTKEDAIQCVKAIPAADVAEVRHGRWVNTHSDSEFAQCSLCKYPVYAAWIWNLTNYCPNCGAKMNLEESK